MGSEQLERGITVVMPTFKGVNRISKALTSLAAQTLDRSLFEILCCVNGGDDGTTALIASFQEQHPDLIIRVLHSEKPGISLSTNIGLAAATKEYFTNIDDDDWVSPSYLETLLTHCAPKRVVMTYICDVAENPSEPSRRFNNYLCRRMTPFAGKLISARKVWVESANSGKAVSTLLAREVGYDETIDSGLDVVFWLQVVTRNRLKVYIPRISEKAFYYRLVRTGSLSRRIDENFITGRFRVIDILLGLKKVPWRLRSLVHRSIRGQIGLLGDAAYDHPDRFEELRGRILKFQTPAQTEIFNHRAAPTLAACYTYTPYNDASAITAAKRLANWDEPFDIITHSMTGIRDIDTSTHRIDSHLRGKFVRIDGAPRSSTWEGLARFCSEGARQWAGLEKDRTRPYKKLYSRVHWPFSHGLAALIKVRRPEIRWIAEFSDPVSININGTLKDGPLGDFLERHEIDDQVRLAGFDLSAARTIHEWIEWITYALADQIIFTNENQRDLMLSLVPDMALRQRAREHCVVIPHPGVPDHILEAAPPVPRNQDGRIHLGYFGWVYPKRGVDDVLTSLRELPDDVRIRVMVHLYVPSRQLSSVRSNVHHYGLQSCVEVNRYVNYVKFVSIARSMDWLIVPDAQVSDIHGTNPYLPSKYADYSSLGVKIWGIIEPGSPLSQRPLDLTSHAGDAAHISCGLQFILSLVPPTTV
ncbi:MAG: glycosyltransferase [Propionibacteriaceae bacterium]|jgi:glycosyltransferase involved in cell wall biosynthesis|nr:glycosyltransferase [Propionibacteriaceae bacterium]